MTLIFGFVFAKFEQNTQVQAEIVYSIFKYGFGPDWYKLIEG